MIPRQQIRYSRLPAVEDDHGDGGRQNEYRFDYLPKSYNKIPWKSIFLALFLLVLGCFLLFLAAFILTGHMAGDSSQAYSLLGLGILAFLPGMSRIWQSHSTRIVILYAFTFEDSSCGSLSTDFSFLVETILLFKSLELCLLICSLS